MDEFAAVGLGLDRGVVDLVEARADWSGPAARLGLGIEQAAGEVIAGVEHVGSSAVPGLLAKPILDFAVGIREGYEDGRARRILERQGWEFWGDSGDQGGLVFILETTLAHRVAHLHVVEHSGVQWRNYLVFRDLLRNNPSARARYASAKASLRAEFPEDRPAYTAGKDSVVCDLLAAHHRALERGVH